MEEGEGVGHHNKIRHCCVGGRGGWALQQNTALLWREGEAVEQNTALLWERERGWGIITKHDTAVGEAEREEQHNKTQRCRGGEHDGGGQFQAMICTWE